MKARKLPGVRQFKAATAANLSGTAIATEPDIIDVRVALNQPFMDAGAIKNFR